VADVSDDGTGLIAQLVQANYNDYAAVSQQLIDGYQKEIAELKAWRDIVRDRMEELCSQPWAPSSNAIYAALMVTRSEIAERIAGES
jgi:hypothetical protein